MKMTYLSPEMETVELKLVGMLCESTGADGGDDDGGYEPTPGNPNDPDWGDDY